MSILSNYLTDIEKIKLEVKEDSDVILSVINLDEIFKMNKSEIKNYIEDILYDYWESKEKLIKKSIKLGEDKAKKIINAI